MSKPFAQALATIVIAGILVGSAAALQAVRETRYPSPPPGEDSLYITSGAAVRRMSAGYNALAADLYWIRTIQYYGSVKLRLKQVRELTAAEASRGLSDYQLLYPMLDLTTSLDPRFNIAYRFGSIFLAETYPGGAGRPDLAIALLEKGVRERPDKWEYMQDIGFVHYWWTHDYKAAADWFHRASEVPGAPWFLRSLAAVTLAEGGDRRSSRILWLSIRQSAEIEWLRNEADRRLKQLDAYDEIEAVQKIVDDFIAREGKPVSDWQTLIRAGVLRGIPADPLREVPLEIDAGGRVRLSPRSPLFPLPDEPKRLITPGA